MVTSRHTDLDIIEELQLRRWAREHYVPPQERESATHPIIAEEMQRKDAEVIINARSREPMSSFVPLVPTVNQRIHTEHQLPEEPKLLRHREHISEMVILDDDDSQSDSGQWIC